MKEREFQYFPALSRGSEEENATFEKDKEEINSTQQLCTLYYNLKSAAEKVYLQFLKKFVKQTNNCTTF